MLPSTYRLMRQAVRSLMEAAPPGIDVAAAERRLTGRPAVTDPSARRRSLAVRELTVEGFRPLTRLFE